MFEVTQTAILVVTILTVARESIFRCALSGPMVEAPQCIASALYQNEHALDAVSFTLRHFAIKYLQFEELIDFL